MKKILLALCLLVAAPILAAAQTVTTVTTCGTPLIAYKTGIPYFATMDTNGNLCTNAAGGGGSGTSSTFGAAFPATGTAAGGEYLSSPPTLTNGQMVALQTDVNGALKVSGLAGTNSNASSAVATSATNLGTISYNYGFNGATWDQLQVDASKNLKTIPTGTADNGVNTVAPTTTNQAAVAYNYTWNGSSWDAFTKGTLSIANSISVTPATSATFPISAASLPLPSLAATSTLQSTGNTSLASLVTGINLASYAGTAITAIPSAYGTAPTGNVIGVNANVTNSIAGIATGGAFSGSNGLMMGGIFGGNFYPMQLNAANGALLVSTSNAGAVTNPTASYTLPSTTTAYTAGQLACPGATPTVAQCNTAIAANPLSIANTAGGAMFNRMRVQVNDALSTSWSGQTARIDLWSAAPTFQTTGDRGAFVTDLLTGTAGWLGSFTCTFAANAPNSDGAYAACPIDAGNVAAIKLASGTSVFWTFTSVNGTTGVTGASKVITVTAELLN